MEHHEAACHINHESSSKAMEQEAAKVIWTRSDELHKLRYIHMLSDGDSSLFAAIVELQPYVPDVCIQKLECINQAGKQLGTALTALARKEHLRESGVGKLNKKLLSSINTTKQQ